ncbi:MAG TPA: hypothetical protein VIY48_18915 [Candidatus Paceibacterota bacterium]
METALTKQYTNKERHEMGDHRGCGSACPQSGNDLRPAPLHRATLVRRKNQRRGRRMM